MTELRDKSTWVEYLSKCVGHVYEPVALLNEVELNFEAVGPMPSARQQ